MRVAFRRGARSALIGVSALALGLCGVLAAGGCTTPYSRKPGESGHCCDPAPDLSYPSASMREGETVAVNGWRADDGSGNQGPWTSTSLFNYVQFKCAQGHGRVAALRVAYHTGTGRERYQVVRPVTVEAIEAARIDYACADWIILVPE